MLTATLPSHTWTLPVRLPSDTTSVSASPASDLFLVESLNQKMKMWNAWETLSGDHKQSQSNEPTEKLELAGRWGSKTEGFFVSANNYYLNLLLPNKATKITGIARPSETPAYRQLSFTARGATTAWGSRIGGYVSSVLSQCCSLYEQNVTDLNKILGDAIPLESATATHVEILSECAARPATTALGSKVTSYFASVADYYNTLHHLVSVNATQSPIAAYDDLMLIIDKESCSSAAIATYLESPESQHVDVLLSCMSDIGFAPSRNLVHCMIGLLHFDDEKIVNCATLALLAGGEYATHQLYDSIEKQSLTHVKSFLRVYSELL